MSKTAVLFTAFIVVIAAALTISGIQPVEQKASVSLNHHQAEVKMKKPEPTLIDSLEKHCIRCHGPQKQKGKVRLDMLSEGTLNADKQKLLQKSMKMITKGEMPPKKKDALSVQEKESILDEFEQFLTANEEFIKDENKTVYRRLNNREYLYTAADIFGFDPVNFNPTSEFPADQRYEGINRIGSELLSSKFLSREYLKAANEIVDKMVRFDSVPKAKLYSFDVGKLHTRIKSDNSAVLLASAHSGDGITGCEIYFKKFKAPEDGYYKFRIRAKALNQKHNLPPEIVYNDQDEPLRLGIKTGDFTQMNIKAVFDLENSEKWYECKIWLNKDESPQLIYPNGVYSSHSYRFSIAKIPDLHTRIGVPKEIVSSEIKRNNRQTKSYVYLNIFDILKKLPIPKIMVKEVQINGPFYDTWTPAQNPHISGISRIDESNLKDTLLKFSEKLFRRPQSQESIKPFIELAQNHLSKGESLEESFKMALKAMLCSPKFLFITEKNSVLDQYETASRLSYFLWSSSPDEQLMQAAAKNELTGPGISREVKRMLKDNKAKRFVENYTASWLKLYDLGGILPHSKKMKDYYKYNLQESIEKETYLYAQYILDNNRSITEFLSSDYSILDRRLSKLYQLKEPDSYTGAVSYNDYSGKAPSTAFVKYDFKNSKRGGLLGHASTLMVSANGIDTSPVVRGVWVLEHLLCQSPPPVPEEVPAIEPDTRGAKSLRDRLKKHQSDESCAGCHRKFDPIGFALENYDAIGKWRTKYRRHKVDSSGELYDQQFKDISGLKLILLSKKDEFSEAFSERLISYAIGRKLTFADSDELKRIHSSFKAGNYGYKDLISLICTSELFLRK